MSSNTSISTSSEIKVNESVDLTKPNEMEENTQGSTPEKKEKDFSALEKFWINCSQKRPGTGTAVGYSLSTFLGVSLLVLTIPPLWHFGYGEIQGLCFGCKTTPVYRLALQPWSTIGLASLYLNGLVAGLYGIYQGMLWAYTGSRQLRRQLLRQRRQQESL